MKSVSNEIQYTSPYHKVGNTATATVRKFNSINQILREIRFVELEVQNLPLYIIHLEALKFDLYEFLHFLKVKIDQKSKFRVSIVAKTAFFELLNVLKLISRKI